MDAASLPFMEQDKATSTESNDRDIVARLGVKIRSLRKAHNLTLEQLAQRSNVSRSMLSQIERGETNPTFGTLWNLAQALGIELSDLVEEAHEEPQQGGILELLAAERTPRIGESKTKAHLDILHPANLVGDTEWYRLLIEPGGALDSLPHSAGSLEHLTVIQGAARVTSGTHSQDLKSGDTIRYRADQAHKIEAIGTAPLEAWLIVRYA